MAIRSVGICLKPSQAEFAGTVRGLDKWLSERGQAVVLDEDAAECVGRSGVTRQELTAQVDLIVVLGGDGTLLSVARSVGERSVPILGVNLGTLGFLTEIALDEMFAALERVFDDNVRIEPRMRLDVRVRRGDAEVAQFLALNEAVISNVDMARIIELEARSSGADVTTYHADGLIVSTPTGSTAYSLSAGGPILHPQLSAMVLTPICSHTLTQRPVVLPESTEIEVQTRTRGSAVQLTVDGQEGVQLTESDVVLIRRSDHPIRIVGSPFRSRFEILRQKLRWGER